MKKLIFIASCLFIVLSTNSQTTIKDNTSAFIPYWTIGANGGINWFYGENNYPINPTASFTMTQNIGYLGRLDVTRQVSPVVGIRGMLGFNKYNYFNTTLRPFYSEHLTADVVFNLTNLKKGYNPDRFFNFSVFGGIGAGYLNNNTTSFILDGMLRGGLQGDFKLSSALNLNLIAEMNILTDNANHTGRAGKPIDLGPALTLGFTYRLPMAAKANAVEPVEIPTVVQPAVAEPVTPPTVIEPEKPVVAQDTIKPEIEAVTPEPEKPLVAETTVSDKLNEHIFFSISQREIQSTVQKESMQRITDFIAAHPDTKVVISGYADRGTGTVEINNMLSKKRAVLVANTLIREYGVPLKNIWVRWFGSAVQPYAKATQNRLVIVRGAATFKEAFAIPNIIKKTETNLKTSAPAKTTSVSSSTTETNVTPKEPEAALFEVLHFAEATKEITVQKQKDDIKKVADYLKRNPGTMVMINGYGDKKEDGDKKSTEISKARALAVADMLTKTHLISSERIQVRWYGTQNENGIKPTMNKMVLITTTK